MTQIIEPNEKSDLKQDIIRRWVSQAFTGILSGFEVTPGASGFTVTIQSGEAWINKEHIDDDETRNSLDLGLSAGADKHYIVYGQYTPTSVFPPSPGMVITAVTNGDDSVPTMPADSVKFADIFVPLAASDINDCRIVNAPPLPDRGANDADTIIERLLNSNMNMLFGGGGALAHNGTDTFTWSEDMVLIATTITNKEKYQSVPLAAVRIPAGTLGPSPVVGPNSILFAVFSRLTPATALTSPLPDTVSLRVLNLDAPDVTEAGAFYDPLRENVVFVGAILDGDLRMRSGFGSPLPAPVADPPASFLRNDPGSVHYWTTISEDDLVAAYAINTFNFTGVTVDTYTTFNGTNGIVIVGSDFDGLLFTAAYTPLEPNDPVNAADECYLLSTDAGQGAPGDDEIANPLAPVSSLTGIGPGEITASGQNVTFALNTERDGVVKNASRDIVFGNRVYWGLDALLAPTIDNAWVEALLASIAGAGATDQSTGKSNEGVYIDYNLTLLRIISVPNEYVYFAHPDHWGTPVFRILGAPDSWRDMGTLQVLNTGDPAFGSGGLGETYRVWGSSVPVTTGNWDSVGV